MQKKIWKKLDSAALPRFDPRIETPEEKIASLEELNRTLSAQVGELRAELAIQKGIVAALVKRIYGAKSEPSGAR